MRKQLFRRIDCKIIVLFIVAFIPRLFITADAVTVRHISDNVALLASPAYLAGYDWSNVVSNAGYYGFGFYALFFWLFRIIDNPITIYKILTIIGAFVQALVAPVSYYFLVHCLKLKKNNTIFLISLICSYFVAVSASAVYNEIPFSLLIWLIVIILCKMVDSENSNNSKFKWSLLLTFFLIYGLTIHTRTWSVIIAVILALILYLLIYRKSLFSFKVIPIAIILYIVTQKCIQYMQNALWSLESSETLKNASISIGKPGLENLSSICKILFSQANSFLIFSAGSLGLAILAILFYCGQKWYDKYKKESLPEQSELVFEKKCSLIGLTMIIAFGGTILAQAISWSYSLNIGDEYSYKACFYLRYAMPFASIVFALGIELLINKKIKLNNIFFVLFLVLLFLFSYLLFILIPEVADQEVCGTAGMGAALDYVAFESVDISNYLLMLLRYVAVVSLLILLWFDKKEMGMLSIVLLVLVYQYFYNDKYIDKLVEEDNYMVVNASYQWFNSLKNEEKEIPDEIYVIDCTNSTDHNNYYMFQLFFFDKTIIPDMPADGAEDVVLFSNNIIDEMEDYEMIKLDKNEYVYLKGKYVDLDD